ncbi:midasin [Xylariaceae sp. FL1019]|nr:midasin [Xylariaceae sp. FL1019]
MASFVDISLQRAQLLDDASVLAQLPPDLLLLIRDHTTANLLDALAAAALIPQHVFADICARWLRRSRQHGQEDPIIAAFARILPFAPHLSVYLNQYISETSSAHTDPPQSFALTSLNAPNTKPSSETSLLTALLAFWRLLNFDKLTYTRLVRPSQVQVLFAHESPLVRYLAIKVFCCHMSSSDLKEEELIQKHVDRVSAVPPMLQGDFDGTIIDYAFLSLFEHKRAVDMDKLRIKSQADNAQKSSTNGLPPQQLTDLVVQYGSVVFPRPNGLPASPTTLIHTPTTLANLERLASNLQYAGPILLQGLPGSGKTSAVYELARELGMESSMVTLHLNEQTDAKMLIGLYSTDSKPGSFSWRPGVLTTAIREGRWVLIEDLDRAPNEVMSLLLPLVEHGKLLIPSRGETIEASGTFRLFATMRTTRGLHGQEHAPSFLGQRFWHLSNMGMPSYAELEEIVIGSYPLLRKYNAIIMSVYKRLCAAPNGLWMTGSRRNTTDRPITPRDLLKWCRRLKDVLVAAGCKTGEEPISDTMQNWMFMEATDCFCGSIVSQDTRVSLAGCIAEEMHLPKQLLEHYLNAHVPHLDDSSGNLRVGRVTLTKSRHANRIVKSKRPFASTSHAKRLLEQIAVAVKLREPVLLVGETGIGKTTVVQQLAETLGHKLVAVNLSQQSEVGDLLGGFKPVNARSLAVPLKEEFEDLFAATGISATKNQKYLELVGKCSAKGQWSRVLKLWREAIKMFHTIVEERRARIERENRGPDERPAIKRRKTESKLQALLDLQPRWDLFAKNLDQFDIQISGGSGNFAFAFVEGNIVKAARNGDWVLLDEINLASPDTLESIADLLASGPNDEPSILLSETGEIERVKAHPDFRIFGAMNPATDVGKRDLPLGLRSRFTELYIGSPDRDLKDLLTIIKTYLSGKSAKDDQAADDIARLYLNTKMRAEEKRLVDGANEVPHFSLRTLTRVLSYVNDVSPLYGLRRALFEGFSMGFLTLLDKASEDTLVPLIYHHLLERHGNPKTLLSQTPRHPNDGKQYVKFANKDRDRHYWLLQGGETPIERLDYIITPYVERNLLNLVRATSTRRFPILIQGPTSAGKTSMIEYLANFSGNKFVRINNHEHTDLQDGKLKFQEGLLVQALREGHWIVLDELNLAPTDLLIPETQEINPPGLYGGRKILSRAFRNRFLELHYDDIPEDELETILQKRSLYTAPSDCKRIVNTSRLFENKDSFATLRDLFRWALRNAESREEIAANGFMLLAERVRNQEERLAVRKVIENVFKVIIDEDLLYDAKNSPYLRKQAPRNCQEVVWTRAMRRLYVLVASALRNNEPVLLVGETGCGKTTELHIVNAHQNTETGDLIGSQRPIRNRAAIVDGLKKDVIQALEILQKSFDGDLDNLLVAYHAHDQALLEKVPEHQALFEWADGSLVQAMPDDSVLERLNSGIDNSFVKAASDFQFLATMNPGGDFGKKELSPALRNRNEDVLQIAIVEFSYWFGNILVWVKFINESRNSDGAFSVIHANPSALIAIDSKSMDTQRQRSIYQLRIGEFAIDRDGNESFDSGFALNAPTTKLNAMRVIRALQVQKPILLEGSPGVACGKPLTRINLSDQTDLMDLFGTDVPVEGAEAGHFAWRDAPFLRAMQNGEWVLLDEMNLASQSVLEGLNACLDHRGEVYISELDQNPHHQGGGRKGLPSSFVNHLILIAKHNFPDVPPETKGVVVEKSFGSQGSPWEFNLRDTLRWLHLLTSSGPLLSTGMVADFLGIAIRHRFRSERDRSEVDRLFSELFHDTSALAFQTGLASMTRIDVRNRLPELESLLISIQHNIPSILVGPSGSALAGRTLVTFPMNADIDAMDLINLATPDRKTQIAPESDLAPILAETEELLERPTNGVIVQALQKGEWLVLDNANLCSASPDGFLIINEHFDPRYGELSRAMRNPPVWSGRIATVEARQQRANDDLIAGDNAFAGTLFSANHFLKSIHTASSSYVAPSDHDLHHVKNFLPLHPLHNSPIIPLLRECPSLNPVWLSICYEMSFILADAWELLERQKATVSNMQISGLNRLQRSLVAESVVAVQKDSTVRSAKFLIGLLQAVEAYLKTQLKNSISYDQHKLVLRDMMHNWRRTFQYLTETQFEEAKFQAHLGHISACLQDHLLLVHLTTGFGMEQLWNILRPTPVPNNLLFNQLSHMERLALQLDEIKWKSGVGLSDLVKITNSFAQAYRLIRSEIEQMNQRLTDESAADTPFLACEFDTIRQLAVLDDMYQQTGHKLAVDELAVLSDTSMATLLRIHSATETSKSMQLMETFMRESRVSVNWNQGLSSSILRKLDIIDAARLRRLGAVETELPILAKHLSTHSQALTSNQAEKLNRVLLRIMNDILATYNPELATILALSRAAWSNASLEASVRLGSEGMSFKLKEVMPPSVTTHLRGPQGVVVKHFVSSLISLTLHEQGQFHESIYLANAWIQLSLALVKLFIPDKPFDPQLRPLTALDSYDQLFEVLKSRLESLRQYEQFKHGQPTSVRIDMAEKDIGALGDRPIETQVTYRPASSGLSTVQTEFNSILRVVHSSDLEAILFRYYFGSDTAGQELEVIRENISRISLRLTHNHRAYEDLVIPTANILHCLEIGLSLGKEWKSQSKTRGVVHASLHEYIPFLGGEFITSGPKLAASSLGLEFLMYGGFVRAIEGLGGVARIQQTIFEKLEADRKTEEAKGSWFHYRGADEEIEEGEKAAFNELFPCFDDESEVPEPKAVVQINNARALSIQVAELHKAIFLGSHNASSGLKDLVKHVARKFGSVQDSRSTENNLLPATLLVLEERLDFLMATPVSNNYNFYTDSNRPEARNIFSLVSNIRARFHQLQRIDEIGHMQPLVNVVLACEKVLDSGVEQLHAFTYGVLPLYTRLTDMLVSWRRLELSTWNRLFDTEIKKCDDDAASWWFIAYQAVIDLQSHAFSLIKELEMYFASAPLHVHLNFLVSEFPRLIIIRDSLRNFIDFYSRYDQPVKDLIQSGRTPIEKKMKDVVLLASWKDTNIKLFHIVRKFRDVLNQPMKLIIDKRLSESIAHAAARSNVVLPSSPTNQAALEVCNETIPGWTNDYKRLANVLRTVQIMRKLGQTSDSTVDAASIAGLRKETPSVLNDENTDLVKHLKTPVKHMGIPYNLALDALAKQDSLSTVLASTASLVDYPLSDPHSPRIRKVTRSIGLFEGILNNTLGQRPLENSCDLIRLLGQTQTSNFGIQMVELHGKFGSLDNQQVVDLLTILESLPELAPGLDMIVLFSLFKQNIHEVCQERPDLAFILEQVLLWTAQDIPLFAQSVKKLCDSILVTDAALRVLRMTQVEKTLSETLHISRQLDWTNSVTRRIVPSQFIDRTANCHKSTCKLGFTLGRSFTHIASQEKAGNSDKLEDGTGLGEGEDLSELAQEKNNDPGDLNSVDGEEEDDKGSESGNEEDKEEIEEETVDEKTWDGENEDDADKDQKEIAGGDDEEKEDEEAADDQEEEIQHQDEQIQQDQHVQEQEALALPDDMDIDALDNDSMSSISDDELDELSNMDDDGSESAEESKEENGQQSDDENDMTLEDAPTEEPVEEDEEQQATDDNNSNPHDVAPSDARGGGGQDQDADQTEEQNNAQNDAEQEHGQETNQEAPDTEQSQGQKGAMSQHDAMDSSSSQPFKALGDALEKWHKRQREIREAQENQSQQPDHDDAATDAQAMGTATEEQTQQIDDAMAIDEEEDPASNILPQESPEEHAKDEDVDIAEARDQHDRRDDQQEERQNGVTTHQGAYSRATTPPANGAQQSEDVEDPIEEASEQLVSTHLEPQSQLRDFDESMQQWAALQSKTHPLSLSLTSQLRLILTPSQSTKLSGSYRTGKRLNIKRIIPYIASSYKRDKIWMRRAIPTKRAYQILLCVDDSSSMGEGKSGDLALEALVMVSRALTMLEVGQVGVLGFGKDVFMAHEFTEPFASHDSGANVLQKFSFQQHETNVHLLVRQTIERFRIARQQSASRGSEDLWQLALILSDGVTPSAEHESIRVLLREAIEERIMIVFIVMDDTAKKDKKESVLNLKKVKFLGNDEIKTEYYLDTFPFQYYLIVHNLEDLPGALSGLLRTWFAEINT